jgi:predicted RNA-binding Zn-ribbon protein involved in translation (DUF1610 family)
MDEIIQLTCPACGGKLNVGANATLLICQHCGTESTVRREAGSVMLESFARCPRCGRNDRAEKVSAIMSSQTQNISSNEMQTRIVRNHYGQPVYQNVAVPKIIKQCSELASKLTAPTKPIPYPKPPSKIYPRRTSNGSLTFGIILLVIAFIGLVFSVIAFSASLSTSTDSQALVLFLCGLPTLLSGLLGILLTVLGITSSGKKKQQYQKAWQSVDLENKKMFENWQEANQQLMSKWHYSMSRWEELYYCHRDDCVFIPEEGSSAPLSKMKEYIEGAIVN